MTSEDQAQPQEPEAEPQLAVLKESLREAQLALESSRESSRPDKPKRAKLSRQVDLLSHLVLMHVGQ